MSRRLKINLLSVLYMVLALVELIAQIFLSQTVPEQTDAQTEAIIIMFVSGTFFTFVYLIKLMISESSSMKTTNKLFYYIYTGVFIISLIRVFSSLSLHFMVSDFPITDTIGSLALAGIAYIQRKIHMSIKDDKEMFYGLYSLIMVVLSIVLIICQIISNRGLEELLLYYKIITYTAFGENIIFAAILYLYGDAINKGESF